MKLSIETIGWELILFSFLLIYILTRIQIEGSQIWSSLDKALDLYYKLIYFDNLKNGHGGGRTLDRCVISTTL